MFSYLHHYNHELGVSFKEIFKYPKSATVINSSTKFKHFNYELNPKGKRWIHESENLQ